MGVGVWCVPTLGAGELILRSTLGGSGCLAFHSTLGGAPGLSSQYLNRFDICLRDSNYVSLTFKNGASESGCSSNSVKYSTSIAAQFAEDMNVILCDVLRTKIYPQTFPILLRSHISGDIFSSP